jgi:hypothetical protein
MKRTSNVNPPLACLWLNIVTCLILIQNTIYQTILVSSATHFLQRMNTIIVLCTHTREHMCAHMSCTWRGFKYLSTCSFCKISNIWRIRLFMLVHSSTIFQVNDISAYTINLVSCKQYIYMETNNTSYYSTSTFWK